MSASLNRKRPFWIDQFTQHTSVANSPAIFRKWGAIATISASLQRKVFVRVQGRPVYPNFYIILVGPPGVGKTQALIPGRDLLETLGDTMSLAPQAVTKEKFIALMAKSTKIILDPTDPFLSQSSMSAFVEELGTFIKPKDFEFMTTLTSLYDCSTRWTSATLSRDEDVIRNVHLTFLGCITPKSLAENFGHAAFGMGFTSRLNLIYSDAYAPPKIFAVKKAVDYSEFLVDLRRIHSLKGEMTFTNSAQNSLQNWVDSGMHPIPTDGKFAEYLPRRWLHLLKLCMVYAASENDSLVISESHFDAALATLLEAEAVMGKAVDFVGLSGVAEPIRNAVAWIKMEYAKNALPITEARLKRVLLKDITPQHLNTTINEIMSSGYVTISISQGGRLFTPLE